MARRYLASVSQLSRRTRSPRSVCKTNNMRGGGSEDAKNLPGSLVDDERSTVSKRVRGIEGLRLTKRVMAASQVRLERHDLQRTDIERNVPLLSSSKVLRFTKRSTAAMTALGLFSLSALAAESTVCNRCPVLVRSRRSGGDWWLWPDGFGRDACVRVSKRPGDTIAFRQSVAWS